ncbi:unnamed protein product [Brassica napus]|nr:unnamed protein product [Brassica napus]
MTRDFPLASSDPNLEALIRKEWGTCGGVRAEPACGWLSTRTSPDELEGYLLGIYQSNYGGCVFARPAHCVAGAEIS